MGRFSLLIIFLPDLISYQGAFRDRFTRATPG